jgi:eukaryotic-like serine/threonine-protein kinase
MRTDPSPVRPLAGTVISDRYELRGLLGRGGMGEVYEAADLRLDRTVAVKVLRAELAADRRFVARFHREARTVARLSHPGIVAVHDVGELDGHVFIVMEHVAGRTLADVVHREGPLRPARVARIGADLAEALAHAHARGVVHRDVTPGNVMLTTTDGPKVLDFGIARAAQGSAAVGSLTAHGTLAYVPPEVLAGRQSDQRVDVYGLGAVLYELLTGAPPFRGSGDADVARRLGVARAVPPRAWNPDMPEGLDDVVRRCLAFRPEERPADLAMLVPQLRTLSHAIATAAPPLSDAPSPTAPVRLSVPTAVLPASTGRLPNPDVPSTSTDDDGAPRPTPKRSLRRRLARWAVGTAVVAAVAGGSALLLPSFLEVATPVRPTAVGPPRLPAPAELSAVTACNGFFSTRATLTWSPVPGASAYQVARRDTADDRFRRVATVGAEVTSITDPDLGIDTRYRYRVRAVDGPRVGAWSPQAEALTPLLCLI